MIKDENDVIITQFKSNKLGMGFCQLKANKDNVYYAEIILNDNTKRVFKLPKIYERGYVLTTKTSQDFFRLQLRSNFSKSDSLFVKAQARGNTFSNVKLQCINGSVKLAFKKNIFPEGIVTFTVFNQENQPICERLVFNYKENSSRLKTVTKRNKKKFSQRDKIIFDINTRQIDNNTNHIVNSSFLVINKRQLGNIQLRKSNILSYFLLESELKGNIDQPSFYFNINNNQRFYAMDALLLTQGWRNYVYKPTEEEIHFKNQPEKNLQLNGSIEEFVNGKKKRKNPINLTLMTLDKKNFQFGLTTLDSLGRFSFELKDIYNDNLPYLIQTKNHKGNNKELTVNIDKRKSLKINFEKEEELQLADKFNIYINENIKRFAKQNPFNVDENGFILDEITVKTRLLTPVQKKMTDEHGEPDVIIEDKELIQKKEKWMSGLFALLEFKYPDDLEITTNIFTGVSYAKVFETARTFIIIDGIPVHINDYPLIGNLPVEEIKSVEIIKFPKNEAKYYDQIYGEPLTEAPDFSFLNIYTYVGKGLDGIVETKGIFKSTLPGFSVKKEFYTPKHENLTKDDWNFPDLRSTVYWEPNVTLDKNGTGTLEFYADDNIGEMLVIIESISGDGKLGYLETTYTVTKKIHNKITN